MRIRDWALAVACAAWSLPGAAQSSIPQTQERAAPMPGGGFESEFDDDSKAWKEIQAQLPPPPKPENLVRVETGGATPHQFFVDVASVSLGSDGVTRYTAVVKTSGGATNVSYEGMRCETREEKLYAVGHRDGTWARARDAKWRRVVLRDLTPHRHTLFHQFFCPSRVPTPVKQAVDALKSGRGLRPDTAGDG